MESLNYTTDEKSKKDSDKKESSTGESTTGRKVVARAVEAQANPLTFKDRAERREKPATEVPELAAEASLSKINEVEKQPVEQQIVAALRAEDQLEEQAPEADPAFLAALVAIERFRDKIDHGIDSELAETETMDEIPLIASEVLEDAELNDEATEIETIFDPEQSDHEEAVVPNEEFIDTYGLSEGEISLSETDSKNESTTNHPTGSSVSGAPASQGAGAAGLPPQPPASTGYYPAGGSSVPNGPNFNVYPPSSVATPNVASDPSMISVDHANYYARRAETRGLLVGGIVGYLIGRRRGRIKTQKKLLPIQKKLEKEVKGLQGQILDKEAAIRAAAVKQVRTQETATVQLQQNVQLERQILKTAPEVKQQTNENSRAPALEANQLHGKKVHLEQIGHVMIAAEALRVVSPEPEPKQIELTQLKSKEKPERLAGEKNLDKATIEKQVTTMTRAELLSLSEKILIDSANLRQIYETHLVGERGLRRIITEYLRGGDFKKALRKELVEREIDFERDPILRDKARAASVSGAGKSVLNNLLQQSGALPQRDDEADVMKSRADYQETIREKKKMRRRTADVSLVSTIVVLLALVLALILSHR